MRSPFPGLDPFLEDQGYWRGFHTVFLTEALYFLTDRMPDSYDVFIEERISLVHEPDDRHYRDVIPDAVILRTDHQSRPEPAPASTAIATLEPVLLSLPTYDPDEVVGKRLTIRQVPDRELVTVVELLSPSNKQSPGDHFYEQKRLELINQPVHLVEIDLLFGGKRLPMKDELPAAHFYAFVSRVEQRFLSQTYAWTIRDPLPRIPIPLSSPDPDVLLDLAAIFETCYERARWGRSIDYARPLKLPLSPEDRAWAESLAPSALRREAR
jgi:hypothetical protein